MQQIFSISSNGSVFMIINQMIHDLTNQSNEIQWGLEMQKLNLQKKKSICF